MLSYENAVTKFREYIRQYDVQDPKIRLKIVHTMGVVKASQYMARERNLNEEDTYLANVIALLHDIGRFEQLRRYNTFDDAVMPHAQCSLDVLFGDGLIRQFVPDPQWDGLIYEAIRNHGVYRMPSGLTGRILMHCCLIRDEDKIDNFRVKAEDSVMAMLNVGEEALGKEPITERIFQDFMNETPILNSDRVTHMDMWVSYLGYLFDFNYAEAIAFLLENNYINRIIDRIEYTNPDTAAKMEQIREKALRYAKRRVEEGIWRDNSVLEK